ncbi:hypothetical protein HR45_01715 [Shewanella mangrovi]|uniref:Uncharacterized protein n=1 Tax=Shewanella mangrovi TaxID=1515746 RepID=A0A094K361_9GAMM|nr:hypothetical protein [Shewanella mangrovi]KFZ39141.1 hypothetical protein HR45_01715 [Shewanella mangrovi]
MTDKDKYDEKFSGKIKSESETIRSEAYKFAIDTRKFEIDLYWKRATYFWAFIAVTFAGYGLLKRSPSTDDHFLEFFLTCFGFILSLAWFFANRGSKQWQENWEHHVDHLEDTVTGPLYKTVLRRVYPRTILQWIDFIFTGPSKHSVSKINQLISLYITCMWGVLVYNSQESWRVCNWPGVEISIFVFTFLAVVGIIFGARTYSGEHGHHLHERESNIVDKDS